MLRTNQTPINIDRLNALDAYQAIIQSSDEVQSLVQDMKVNRLSLIEIYNKIEDLKANIINHPSVPLWKFVALLHALVQATKTGVDQNYHKFIKHYINQFYLSFIDTEDNQDNIDLLLDAKEKAMEDSESESIASIYEALQDAKAPFLISDLIFTDPKNDSVLSYAQITLSPQLSSPSVRLFSTGHHFLKVMTIYLTLFSLAQPYASSSASKTNRPNSQEDLADSSKLKLAETEANHSEKVVYTPATSPNKNPPKISTSKSKSQATPSDQASALIYKSIDGTYYDNNDSILSQDLIHKVNTGEKETAAKILRRELLSSPDHHFYNILLRDLLLRDGIEEKTPEEGIVASKKVLEAFNNPDEALNTARMIIIAFVQAMPPDFIYHPNLSRALSSLVSFKRENVNIHCNPRNAIPYLQYAATSDNAEIRLEALGFLSTLAMVFSLPELVIKSIDQTLLQAMNHLSTNDSYRHALLAKHVNFSLRKDPILVNPRFNTKEAELKLKELISKLRIQIKSLQARQLEHGRDLHPPAYYFLLNLTRMELNDTHLMLQAYYLFSQGIFVEMNNNVANQFLDLALDQGNIVAAVTKAEKMLGSKFQFEDIQRLCEPGINAFYLQSYLVYMKAAFLQENTANYDKALEQYLNLLNCQDLTMSYLQRDIFINDFLISMHSERKARFIDSDVNAHPLNSYLLFIEAAQNVGNKDNVIRLLDALKSSSFIQNLSADSILKREFNAFKQVISEKYPEFQSKFSRVNNDLNVDILSSVTQPQEVTKDESSGFRMLLTKNPEPHNDEETKVRNYFIRLAVYLLTSLLMVLLSFKKFVNTKKEPSSSNVETLENSSSKQQVVKQTTRKNKSVRKKQNANSLHKSNAPQKRDLLNEKLQACKSLIAKIQAANIEHLNSQAVLYIIDQESINSTTKWYKRIQSLFNQCKDLLEPKSKLLSDFEKLKEQLESLIQNSLTQLSLEQINQYTSDLVTLHAELKKFEIAVELAETINTNVCELTRLNANKCALQNNSIVENSVPEKELCIEDHSSNPFLNFTLGINPDQEYETSKNEQVENAANPENVEARLIPTDCEVKQALENLQQPIIAVLNAPGSDDDRMAASETAFKNAIKTLKDTRDQLSYEQFAMHTKTILQSPDDQTTHARALHHAMLRFFARLESTGMLKNNQKLADFRELFVHFYQPIHKNPQLLIEFCQKFSANVLFFAKGQYDSFNLYNELVSYRNAHKAAIDDRYNHVKSHEILKAQMMALAQAAQLNDQNQISKMNMTMIIVNIGERVSFLYNQAPDLYSHDMVEKNRKTVTDGIQPLTFDPLELSFLKFLDTCRIIRKRLSHDCDFNQHQDINSEANLVNLRTMKTMRKLSKDFSSEFIDGFFEKIKPHIEHSVKKNDEVKRSKKNNREKNTSLFSFHHPRETISEAPAHSSIQQSKHGL